MRLTKQKWAIKISWPDSERRSDRFCFCSFASSWRFWGNSRQRDVQVGIWEELETIELWENKMGAVLLCLEELGP